MPEHKKKSRASLQYYSLGQNPNHRKYNPHLDRKITLVPVPLLITTQSFVILTLKLTLTFYSDLETILTDFKCQNQCINAKISVTLVLDKPTRNCTMLLSVRRAFDILLHSTVGDRDIKTGTVKLMRNY